MNITKVELRDNGINGLIVSGTKTALKEEGTVFIDYNDTHKVPVPIELRNKIQAFKPYMAIVLNAGVEAHVREAFSSETRDVSNVSITNFLDSLTITKVSKNDDIFRIAGKICNLDNQTIGLSTSAIGPETEYTIYDELCDLFDEVKSLTKDYAESAKLVKMEPRQYMLDLFHNDQDQQANVSAMTDSEVEAAMIHKLEEKGHIILSPPQEEEENSAPVVQDSAPVSAPVSENITQPEPNDEF